LNQSAQRTVRRCAPISSFWEHGNLGKAAHLPGSVFHGRAKLLWVLVAGEIHRRVLSPAL
jgi:hypothetical protein